MRVHLSGPDEQGWDRALAVMLHRLEATLREDREG